MEDEDDGDDVLDDDSNNTPNDRVFFDVRICPFRSEVERTFAKIKRFRFLIDGNVHQFEKGKLRDIVRIVCAIVNFQISNRKKK